MKVPSACNAADSIARERGRRIGGTMCRVLYIRPGAATSFVPFGLLLEAR
jgi:hypothetical protein